MSDAAVVVTGLTVRRGGNLAVDELSCSVLTGEVTGLLGPSGSGKTTVMRAMLGVQQVDAGRVQVLGQPAGAAALRDRVGYVSQAPSVYDDLSVGENVHFFARVLGVSSSETERVLHAVDLHHRAGDRVGRLSGGQRSRVSLAVALLGSPDVLVLDEPTVGLDPVLRRDLWSLFHRLAAGGAAVLVSSHVMDEAERCDRLLLMRDGRLIAEDTPSGLLRRTGAGTTEEAFLRLVDDGDAQGDR